jgi:hypothetical protein
MPTFTCSAMTLPAQLHADDTGRLAFVGVDVTVDGDGLLLSASKRLGNRGGGSRAVTYQAAIALDSLQAATSTQVNAGPVVPGARGALSAPARAALGVGLRTCARSLGAPAGDALRDAARRLTADGE